METIGEIYLDNAATTPIKKEVLEEMLPFLEKNYGNPSSSHMMGRIARQGIVQARKSVAHALGCETDEIYFTSGGTESDNWALRGCAQHLKKQGKRHIISSVIEHHAILHALDILEKEGFEITRLPVDREGMVQLENLESSIRADTGLITIMYANNEIGTIQRIKEMVEIAHNHDVLFHTDAVQAVGTVKIDLKKLAVDLLSFSAHKFNGPKGVGGLYVRRGVLIAPYIAGGMQENGKRAGTENVAGIVGLAKALELANNLLEEKSQKNIKIRNYMLSRILCLPKVKLNGSFESRLPSNLNITFEGVEGARLLEVLNQNGIYCSSNVINLSERKKQIVCFLPF